MKATSNRKFGLMIAAIVLFLAIYQAMIKHEFIPLAFAGGILFMVAAIFFPNMLAPMNRIWHWLANILGTLNTWIMLTLLYILILTPLGFFMRILGKNTFITKKKKGMSSYWQASSPVEGSTLKKQF